MCLLKRERKEGYDNGYSLFLELKKHGISSSVCSFSDHCKYYEQLMLAEERERRTLHGYPIY